tara:strand:+ start:13795 stop:16383 length:2589 start_codon:yes stop_codon:yes gene_type:complete
MSKIIEEAKRKIKLNPLEKWSKKEDFWGHILYTIGLSSSRKNRAAIKNAVKNKTGSLLYGRDYSWLISWAKKQKKSGKGKKRNRQIGLDGIFIWRFRKYNNDKVWNIPKPAEGLKSKSPYKGRYFCKEDAECGPGFHFETFYDEIRKCFGEKWQDSVLVRRGMDYKFGPEHASALADLLAAKKKGCSTVTGEPPESVKKKNCEPSGGKWDGENCICPEGKVLDKATGKCVDKKKVRNNELLQKQCENSGGVWDIPTQTCKCTEGKVYNKKNGFCEDPNERPGGPRKKSDLDRSDLLAPVSDAEKEKFATSPSHPDLVLLRKGATGEIVIVYGENDPLGKRSKKVYNADAKTKEWFGVGVRKYLADNKSDTQRPMTVKRADGTEVQVRDDREYKQKYGGFKKGDEVTSAATYHPIHVMFAAEEFASNFKADSYQWVFIKTKVSENDLKAITLAEQRMAFWGTTAGIGPSLGKGVKTKGVQSKAGSGTLRIGLAHPPEGLDNKDLALDSFDKYVEETKQVFSALANMPGPVDVDGKAIDGISSVKRPSSDSIPHVIPSGVEPTDYVFKLLLPKGWKEGKALTDAEALLAKRVGAKFSGERLNIFTAWPSWIPKKYKDPEFWPCDEGWPPKPSLSYSQAKDDPEKFKQYKVELYRRLRYQCECVAKGEWNTKTKYCRTRSKKSPPMEKKPVDLKLPSRTTATMADEMRTGGIGLDQKEMDRLLKAFPETQASRAGLTSQGMDAARKLRKRLVTAAKIVKALKKFRYPGHKKFKKADGGDTVFTREAYDALKARYNQLFGADVMKKIALNVFNWGKRAPSVKKENLNLEDLEGIIRERVKEIQRMSQDDTHLEEEFDLEEGFLEET